VSNFWFWFGRPAAEFLGAIGLLLLIGAIFAALVLALWIKWTVQRAFFGRKR
jgi:hypothetical protein